LNNAVAENIEQMGKEQIQWLEKDLKENRDKDNIFVFMHKPFWANGIAEKREDQLHDIFKENNVDVVFTGHWHQFASNEYDSVRYILLGSSGGDWGSAENIELGMFYQFLWCKVEGNKFYPTLIKSGNFYSINLVTIEEEKLSYEIPNNLVSFKAERTSDEKFIDGEVSIINKTDRTIENEIIFKFGDNWEIKEERNLVKISKGDTLRDNFELIQIGEYYPLPIMEFKYPFGRNKIFKYSQPVWIKKNVVCPKVLNEPVIDGKIGKNEWNDSGFAFDFSDFNGNKTRVDETKVHFMHDELNLYIFARCFDREMDKLKTTHKNRDDPVYGDDCVGFLLSPNEKDIYHIYINASGTNWDQKVDLEKEETDLNWNGEYVVRCDRNKDNWTVEMKIPLCQIGAAYSENEIKMNIRRKQQRNNESALWMLEWAYTPSRYGSLLFK
jgi:hypothetical protein